MNGTNKIPIITENLHKPLRVTVDHTSAKLYWLTDEENTYYHIEQSNFDGSDRTNVISIKHQQLVNFAVDKNFIYWTDYVHSAVWQKNKNLADVDRPNKHRIYVDNDRDDHPVYLLTRDNVGSDKNCDAMKKILYNNESKSNAMEIKGQLLPIPVVQNFNNFTTSIGQQTTTIECHNRGSYDVTTNSCLCKPG